MLEHVSICIPDFYSPQHSDFFWVAPCSRIPIWIWQNLNIFSTRERQRTWYPKRKPSSFLCILCPYKFLFWVFCRSCYYVCVCVCVYLKAFFHANFRLKRLKLALFTSKIVKQKIKENYEPILELSHTISNFLSIVVAPNLHHHTLIHQKPLKTIPKHKNVLLRLWTHFMVWRMCIQLLI